MKPYFQNHILGKINGTYLQWKASTTSLRPLRVQFDSGLLIEILHRRILHVPKSELSISTSLRSIDRYRGCLINTGGYLNSLTVSGFRPCPCHVFTSKGPHVCFLSRLMPSKALLGLEIFMNTLVHWLVKISAARATLSSRHLWPLQACWTSRWHSPEGQKSVPNEKEGMEKYGAGFIKTKQKNKNGIKFSRHCGLASVSVPSGL